MQQIDILNLANVTFSHSKLPNTTFEVKVAELPVATVNYLLQYGFKQAMADAMAGAEDPEAAVTARYKKLLEGTMGQRASAERLSPEQRIRQDIAKEFLRHAAKAQGKKLPKDKELAELVAKLWGNEKFAKAQEAEVKRRLKAAETTLDLNELGVEF